MKNQKNTTAAISRPRVYICCPNTPEQTDPILRANEMIANLQLTHDASEYAKMCGYTPIAPYMIEASYPSDETPEERELFTLLCLDAVRKCSVLGLFSERITEEMSAEIKTALEVGIPVMYFTAHGFESYIGNGSVTDEQDCED